MFSLPDGSFLLRRIATFESLPRGWAMIFFMRKLYFVFFLVCCAFAANLPFVQGAGVVVNEIMYHPPSTNLSEQWFELFNTATNPVDLSGWKTSKGVEFAFPTNTILPGDGYLVVAADTATFQAKNPGIT